MLRFFAAAAVLLALTSTSPAWAAEFFLAKDPATGTCDIVAEKPDGTKMLMVGTQAYATKDEAKAAKKAANKAGECIKKGPKKENKPE
jgi:hypothetical protein